MSYRYNIDTVISGTPLAFMFDPYLEVISSIPGSNLNIISVFLKLSDAVSADDIVYFYIKGAETGSHTGSDDAAILSDSSKSWEEDELIGQRVYNVTDGSWGEITDNTATTITATLANGTDNDWDTGDTYYVVSDVPRFNQSFHPSYSSEDNFLCIFDSCKIFKGEVFEIYFDNNDPVTIDNGSNLVLDFESEYTC